MVKLKSYSEKELPESIKWQILSFIRVEWPEGFSGKNELRDWIHKKEHHPQKHFVLVTENNLVASYTGVVWKHLEHEGVTYKAYGISGVFTYPSFRKRGYGSRVVKEAKKYIEETDADICIFTSRQREFYEKLGFVCLGEMRLLKGDADNPMKDDEYVLMLFLSGKGKAGRKDFETKPVYFGEEVW